MSIDTPWLAPRAVTDEEQRFFADNGWVKLDGLVSEEATGSLRSRLEQKMGVDAAVAQHPAGDSRGNG